MVLEQTMLQHRQKKANGTPLFPSVYSLPGDFCCHGNSCSACDIEFVQNVLFLIFAYGFKECLINHIMDFQSVKGLIVNESSSSWFLWVRHGSSVL